MFGFFFLEVVFFLLFVGYLVYSYSSKTVPLYVLFFVYTSWLLSFSIVVILPLDIYYVKLIRKLKFYVYLYIYIHDFMKNHVYTYIYT